MSLKYQVNQIRRRLFKTLTRNLDVTRLNPGEKKPTIKRILIIRPNHRLGNLLLTTPLIQEVIDLFPDVKIDLFVKGGLAPIVFRNYGNIDSIIQLPKKPFKDLVKYISGWLTLRRRKYDLVINAVSGSSSGKLSAMLANAAYIFPGEIDDDIKSRYPAHRHIALYSLYSFRSYISKLGFDVDWEKLRYLDLKLNAEEIEEGRKIRNRLTGNDGKTIALYTFATGNKCYSETWWQTFHKRLKEEFPQYNIIEVLPVENISMLGFKITSYYSKDIREIGSVIANMSVFIGADSGIMHLASAANAPTVGLFSVTNEEVYKPYNKGSLAINTNKTTIDNWMTDIHEILDEN